MKHLAVASLAVALALTLTGCELPKPPIHACVEAGGSFESGIWGQKCTMPGVES